MATLLEYWTDRLREDLAGFADPNTPVEVTSSGKELQAGWQERGRSREETFRLSQSDDFRWTSEAGKAAPYNSFLSGEGMADFAQLAAAMCRKFQPRDDFVATDARLETVTGELQDISANPESVRQEVIGARGAAEGRTSLFFIKGDAGAGKTTLLHELTALQAKKHEQGHGEFLFFFVSAQGRALSNLRDAFSGELQDLRARFTRDAVPALARAGLLVPVIDGFDELLGAAGYGDAFNSLRQFLMDLHGLGLVVVSARSAFYNVEFISRGPQVSEADLALRPVSLLPWSDDQLDEYLTRRQLGKAKERNGDLIARLDARDKQLLTKPFFASQFPEFIESRQGVGDAGGGLLDHLIDAYLEREAGKVLGASGDPILSADGHRQLLEEAAEHMWNAEKRQLGTEELQTLVEMVAEGEGIGGDESRQLITKVVSSAGFQTQGAQSSGQFTFDHEVYFEYFLSRTLARELQDSGGLGSFFDRGVLPDDVVDSAVERYEGEGIIEEVSATTSLASRHDNRRRNAGSIIAAYARFHGPVQDTVVRNAAFTDVDFGPGVFRSVTFENCEFIGSRLDRTTFEACDASTSRFQGVVVTNESRIGIAGIVPGANFGSLIHPDVSAEVFSPQEVAEILRRLGAPLPGEPEQAIKYSPQAKVLIKLLEHMARGYRRANVLFESDRHLSRLFEHEQWPELRKRLTKHRVVREEPRAVSGPRVETYRLLVGLDDLVSAENVVDLPDGPVGDFWSDLRELK